MKQKGPVKPQRTVAGKRERVRPSVQRKQKEDRRRALVSIAAVAVIAVFGFGVTYGLKAYQGDDSSAHGV
ncbi:MAG: hypothetical protein J5818_02325, partial [Eggerthellaceae bacterium]|nr:hypothetical protein [Eggerthellaceae bacterium]